MPSFNYRVKDQNGKSAAGVVEARSDKDAAQLLREQGFLVIELTPAGGGLLPALTGFFKKVSFGEIVAFTRQLSTMITAGLTLTDALTLLRRQIKNQTFDKILSDILHEIEAGSSFADVLEKYPQCFSKIYVSLIRAGEASGKLDLVLARLAENLENEREFKAKIKGAMIYPAIIVIGMVAVIFLMMTVVVPKLTAMYKDFGAQLPLLTRILITISDIFAQFWWLILAGIFGFFFLFSAWKKTPVGRKSLDKIILKIPIWGSLTREALLAEMTRTLGLLVGAGISILEALGIVAEAVGSEPYAEAIRDAESKVEKGFPLGVTLAQNPLFPPLVGQMINVGEETGKLDETLLRVSKVFESSSSEKVKGLTTAIEPIILVVLGVGVGFLMLAIIMPMYTLMGQF